MPKTPARYERVAFVASPTPEAEKAALALTKRYGSVALDAADVVVALGGDGLMPQTLHRFMTNETDLRHASRNRRLPSEDFYGGWPHGAACGSADHALSIRL